MNNNDYPQGHGPERHAGPRHENRFASQIKKPVVFIPAILLLLFLVLYLYKESQLNDAREQAKQEQAAVVEQANQKITANSKYFLQVLTKPLSWALRSAMLTGNVEQVDEYLFQFVQEKKFALVLVADTKGNIISSTDQNFTGAAFADHFKADYLSAEKAIVDETDPKRITVVSPIMGFNSKLGTLLAVYLPDAPIQGEAVDE